MENCLKCHDTGLVVAYHNLSASINGKYYIASCNECGMGTEVRCHTMMHSQDKYPCGCPYEHIFNYWTK